MLEATLLSQSYSNFAVVKITNNLAQVQKLSLKLQKKKTFDAIATLHNLFFPELTTISESQDMIISIRVIIP